MESPEQAAHQKVYYLISAFLFGAAFLRTILIYWNRVELLWGVGLLLSWLILFVSEPSVTRKWPGYFPFYLGLQTLLAFSLLFMPIYPDYFSVLFAILSMQIMRIYSVKTGAILIAVCIPLMAVPIARSVGLSQSIALVLVYTSANILLASYSWNVRRAQAAREKNQALSIELIEANHQLQESTSHLGALAVARERNNLARDLHDSVTQTIFSMTLTAQAALMLIDRDFNQVKPQLERLNQLGQGALAEMQVLISELGPQKELEEGLASAIRQHLKGSQLPENLTIHLDVDGEESLQLIEARDLFRIVQEAINNIIKHSKASQATIRLHLEEFEWIEIEDNGIGFDLQQAQNSSRIGLSSMRERAAEIGWNLCIRTSPDAGTTIRVEKRSAGESKQDGSS